MTKDNGTDSRFVMANGRMSKPRQMVLEALEAMGSEGGTTDELTILIGANFDSNNPKMSIGKTLSGLLADEYVVMQRGRWYEKNCAPAAPALDRIASVKVDQPRIQVATYVGKRSEKTVSIYTTPNVLTDVIGLALLIANHWYKIPLFASIRICIGQEAPHWSPEQEVYSDVTTIRITHKGGKVTEEHPARTDLITIAPEE